MKNSLLLYLQWVPQNYATTRPLRNWQSTKITPPPHFKWFEFRSMVFRLYWSTLRDPHKIIGTYLNLKRYIIWIFSLQSYKCSLYRNNFYDPVSLRFNIQYLIFTVDYRALSIIYYSNVPRTYWFLIGCPKLAGNRHVPSLKYIKHVYLLKQNNWTIFYWYTNLLKHVMI